MNQRFDAATRLGAIGLLLVGCLLVLRPFFAAIMFAAAVSIATWPLYVVLLGRCKGRSTLAALAMTLTITMLVVLPLAWGAYNVSDDIGRLYEQIKHALEAGKFAPPLWLRDLPLVGEWLDAYLRELIGSPEQLAALGKRMLEPARNILLSGTLLLGVGVVQISLAGFVSFFLYRDGPQLLSALSIALERLIGPSAAQVAGIVSRTVRGVMYGILGTALAQALVAAAGFALAGVPGVPLLLIATFVLSLIPVGPPLIWGGATLWLVGQGQQGWAVFMLLWGVFAISSVDNVVKPLLISHGSRLPFLLVLLGVMGGVLAFGFVGLFIGPTLLALGFTLARDWVAARDAAPRHGQ